MTFYLRNLLLIFYNLFIQTFAMSSFTPFYNSLHSYPNFYFLPWQMIALYSMNLNQIQLIKKSESNGEIKIIQPIQVKNYSRIRKSSHTCDEYVSNQSSENYRAQQTENNGRIQCQGRNDYSNILKSFVHILKNNADIKQQIKRIIEVKSLSVSYEKFHMKIRRKFSKGKTYISPKEVMLFIDSCVRSKDEGEKCIGLIFKIVLNKFLKTQYMLCLIKGFKGKKQSPKDLMSKTRQLHSLIFLENSLK